VTDAATVLERCAALGTISEEPGRLLRRYATPAMREANELVAGWMEAAGLSVRTDAVGNLIGRREGARPEALLLGSHLDTVPNAGRYDGPLGVLSAIAVVERVGELPFSLEVIGFADEEGVRFGTSFLASSALVGAWDPAWLTLTDADGITLGDALRAFGGDPDGIERERRPDGSVLAYCELHIEQGPVLEALGEPVGLVTAIAGRSAATVRFTGMAGHAGTVPMEARHDALAAAAELVLVAESLARGREGLVATAGVLDVEPGAANVIPGAARLVLDVRSGADAVRTAAVAALREAAESIGANRGVEVGWEETAVAAVPLELRPLAAAAGEGVPQLPSGAGHDAMMLARMAPASMLFVRCRGGISHHPDEHVEEADVAVALDVLERSVRSLAA
jgi:allantoate deiminase